LNFVRHVQGGSSRRSAVAAISFLAVARDDSRSMRLQVEPADALIVQIAEVQRSVGSDDQTVWIVHFVIRITSDPVPMIVDTDGVAAVDGRTKVANDAASA
jgi:hypothetical protein